MADFSIDTAFADVLAALKMAGSAAPAVESVISTFLPLFTVSDQKTLQEALADAQLENDEGFARLDKKLAAAALRT